MTIDLPSGQRHVDETGYLKDLADADFVTALSATIGAQVDPVSRAVMLASSLSPADTPPVPTVAPTENVPTVEWSSTSQWTSGYRLVAPFEGAVTQVGSRGTWDPSAGRMSTKGLSGLDFYFMGDALEIQVLTNNNTGGEGHPFWLWVDGHPVTATPDESSPTTTALFYIQITFPSSARRRIEFFAPSTIARWYGVRAPYSGLVTPAPRKPVVAWIGDSFYGGSDGTRTIECVPFIASRMLGVEAYSVSYGGTGYVSTSGSFTAYGEASRVSDVAAGKPDLIVIQGSVNDDPETGVQAAAAATYAALDAACPGVPIIVLGPQPTAATPTIAAARAANIAAVKAAAVAAPNVIAFHDEVGSASGTPPGAFSTTATYNDGDLVTYLGSVWRLNNAGATSTGGSAANTPGTGGRWQLVTWAYTGTGKIGAPAGDGTRDTFLYSDGIHPTTDGSLALAVRTVGLIRDDVKALASVAN